MQSNLQRSALSIKYEVNDKFKGRIDRECEIASEALRVTSTRDSEGECHLSP